MEVKYAEARLWTYYLRVFTARELADSMGVTIDSIQGMLLGLQFNDTIVNTGDVGSGGEPLYEFVPLPANPSDHPTLRPEWSAAPGVGVLAPRNRGQPVRIRTERDTRRTMSTPGARGRLKRREQRFQAMKARVKEREEKREVKTKAKRAQGKRDWE